MAIFNALTVSPMRPLWPGLPMQITRNQTEPRTEERMRRLGGLHHDTAIGLFATAHHGQRPVTAHLLFYNEVCQNIPPEPHTQAFRGHQCGEQRGDLSFGITGTSPMHAIGFHTRFERMLLAFGGRHDIEMGIEEQRPPAIGSGNMHAQVRSPLIRDSSHRVGVVLVLAKCVSQWYTLHLSYFCEALGGALHGFLFLAGQRRKTDQIAEKLFSLALQCLHGGANFGHRELVHRRKSVFSKKRCAGHLPPRASSTASSRT